MADRKKKNVKKNDDDTDESNSKLDSSMKNLNFVSKDYSSNSTDDKIRCSEVWDYENQWSYSFSDSFDNTNDCLCSCLCPFCFYARLFRRTGECFCMFCVPGSLLSLRSKLRSAFRIKGTLFRDCVAVTFCPCCTAIQMKNELETRGF